MKHYLALCMIVVCGWGCGTLQPTEQPKQSVAPKQKPIPCVQGCVQFVPDTWAIYDLHDPQKNTDSRMYFALVNRVAEGSVSGMWFEVEITQKGQPAVVTRFLAEESVGGFGKLLDAIVQVEGYEPFRVPKRYLNVENTDSPQFKMIKRQPDAGTNAPPKTTMVLNGRTLHVYDVKGKDENDRPIRAVVTDEVPPLSLVSAETADLTMKLVDWGGGVGSKITGNASSLWWWITKQVGKGLMEGSSSPPSK